MSLTDELKPCPFCGGPARIYAATEGMGGFWIVECLPCSLSFVTLRKEGAIEKWNRRAAHKEQSSPLREEYAWLIEREGPEWWTGISYHLPGEAPVWIWSTDALDAVRFCRREDAAKGAVASGITSGAYVTEHGFAALTAQESAKPEEKRHGT